MIEFIKANYSNGPLVPSSTNPEEKDYFSKDEKMKMLTAHYSGESIESIADRYGITSFVASRELRSLA